MDLNVNNLVRSAVVLVVGLPVSLSVASSVSTNTSISADREARSVAKTEEVNEVDALKKELTLPCVRYVVSKSDSKLERTAKNEIDELLGGEVTYGEVCKWVL